MSAAGDDDGIVRAAYAVERVRVNLYPGAHVVHDGAEPPYLGLQNLLREPLGGDDLDFPEPLTPVITVILRKGISRLKPFRLFCLASMTFMDCSPICYYFIPLAAKGKGGLWWFLSSLDSLVISG